MTTSDDGNVDGAPEMPGGAETQSTEFLSARMQENLNKIEEISTRLSNAVAQKAPMNTALEGPGQDLYLKAASAFMANMMQNPARMFEHQVGYWTRSVAHFMEAQKAVAEGEAPADTGPSDKRFKDPAWTENPYFNFIKQQYQLNSAALNQAVEDLDGVDDKDRQRVTFFTRQLVDLMAPTNFLATNPEALAKAVETEGQSLVTGLENLVRDVEANAGDLLVTLADKDAFEVGENIATAAGEVVFRNRMFELIQFAPTTEKVSNTPLLIFPPWINKYYVLDLKPQNSMIRWAVDQGFTVFVVSWVNPDSSFSGVGLDTYIEDGYFAAINAVKEITGEKQVNAAGYCVAGTVLTLALGILEKRGDTSVGSATFFTTLTDFENQGEFGVFLEDDFVDGIESQIDSDGILKSYFMSRTFSYLRANDLVYGPAIRSYMMGESPPAFDLLFWNGDSTNLPGRMTMEYLRGLCQRNELATEGFDVLGETVALSQIKTPLYAVACETDHIAAWQSSFNGFAKFGSPSRTFVLSESGHIAGIVNPPGRKKYGHFLNGAPKGAPDDWRNGAKYHEGSWWSHWATWLKKHGEKQVVARTPGSKNYPPLGAAPGIYVKGGRFES